MSQAVRNLRGRDEEPKGGRRSNGGQLAGLLFLLMVLGTILWGGWMVLQWMKDASRLPLSRLVVTGERHYTTHDDIRQAILSLGAPGTFMTQDVDVIQQQIERLPWIKQASVRKQWPDELKIHLVEYVPVARWNDQLMVDAEGNSFSVPAERVGNRKMPLLYGPEGSENDVLEGYRTMSQVLASSKMTLKMVAMSARHSWQLGLEDDIRLELGRDERARRLERFLELYPLLQRQAQNDNKRVSYVDLRYDTGAAVGWAPPLLDQQHGNAQRKDVDQKQNGNQQQNQAQAKQQ
ncbi:MULTISPECIES: cell division protein FtsQ [Symbiopectobacterium]|uniref:cell division protein FtsQ n=1 Tax=Symbiopectobacterium TaxID=801 RepID=UPI001A2BAD96|nr:MULTISPECIES: cell division protein FtsQ [Symbiopectobacterium]MBG6248961.1 cell division protein FtsQ [Candidatus Symbiopectobacterium sp. PLON1]MBT9429022.1 cell division protein FtsQ [Candidatus Symbiopectobacterium endolongispinus]